MLAVGTNGLRLKKGSVWAPQEPGKRPPPPPQLGVEGQGLDEHGPGATPREGAGHPVPRPPSSRTGVHRRPASVAPAHRPRRGVCTAQGPGERQHRDAEEAGSHLAGEPDARHADRPGASRPRRRLRRPSSSPLLSWRATGRRRRRLAPGAITGSSRSTSTSTSKDGPAVIGAPGTASAAGDAAPRGGAEEPPPGMARGGAEEIACACCCRRGRRRTSSSRSNADGGAGEPRDPQQPRHPPAGAGAAAAAAAAAGGTGSFTKKAGGGDGGGGGSGEVAPTRARRRPAGG